MLQFLKLIGPQFFYIWTQTTLASGLKYATRPKDKIRAILRSIPLSNADTERAFSYAKYFKTDIQSRLDTENFTRNVFLKLTEEIKTLLKS